VAVGLGVMLTEIILVMSVLALRKQMMTLNQRLNSTVDVIADKLHLIVDKINFDIPKIMEQARLLMALFKTGSGKESAGQ
jgi:hypothetical protein